MKILILGGSVFLGRALVDAALSRGHAITLFNRGRSNPQLFGQVEKLLGERDGGLTALENRTWDAVIDTCGYLPRIVRQSAELLAGRVGLYTFISSISVYADTTPLGIDKDAAVSVLADENIEEINGDTYGGLKALCEKTVLTKLPGKSLIIRPGLIVGAHDPTDRFTYWPWRVARGGEVLAPGRPGRVVQFIDVRDLADWSLHMLEQGRTGIFNADGPLEPISMLEVLAACRDASRSDAAFTWVSEAFLGAQNVEPWMQMPLWIPESDPAHAGFFAFSHARAVAAGLRFRPLSDTVQAILAWLADRPEGHPWRAGLSLPSETDLLQVWHRQASG